MRPPATSNTPYPTFDPHITLLSLPEPLPVSLEELYHTISSDQKKPLHIKFKSIDIGDHFFRSVLLNIQLTPDLEQLHQHIHQTLKVEPRTPLFPHLSLCYIQNQDAENGERQRFYDQLVPTKTNRHEQSGTTFSVNCGVPDTDSVDWMDGFECTEILAVECTGPIESWGTKQRISLDQTELPNK